VALVFDQPNALIEVTNPQVTVDIQTLIDAIRAEEASELGITYPAIAGASGKEDLGDSVAVGITTDLLNNWQLHFWEGNYIAKISGGNLVGGIGGDPVAYSAGVQVLLIQSAASTVVSVGGSALTSTEHDQLMGLINGLTAEQSAEMSAIYKSHMHKRTRNATTRVITVFEDDNVTPFAEFDSNDDISEITPR
jgi:hypothetical protein